MSEIDTAPLTADERSRLAALVLEKGWTTRDLQSLALRHVEETGSRDPNRIARWLLAGGAS